MHKNNKVNLPFFSIDIEIQKKSYTNINNFSIFSFINMHGPLKKIFTCLT